MILLFSGTGNVLKVQHLLHICSEHHEAKDQVYIVFSFCDSYLFSGLNIPLFHTRMTFYLQENNEKKDDKKDKKDEKKEEKEKEAEKEASPDLSSQQGTLKILIKKYILIFGKPIL